MKKQVQQIFYFLLLSLLVFACAKEEDAPYIPVDAGRSMLDLETEGYKIELDGTVPQSGQTGRWSVFRGSNGTFEDVTDYNTTFYGEPGELYTLIWEIKEDDHYKTDMIDVSFKPIRTTILSEFPDTVNNTFTLHLEADSVRFGAKGYWTFESDGNGEFENDTLATTTLLTYPHQTYTITWHVEFGSKSVVKEFTVYVDSLKADAGGNRPNVKSQGDGTLYTTLTPNWQEGSTAKWTLLGDTEGKVYNTEDPYSLFEGKRGEIYQLKWEVSHGGYTDIDTVELSFGTLHDSWTDPRDNQTYKTIKLNGLEWMAENYNYEVSPGVDSWYYGLAPDAKIDSGGYKLMDDAERKMFGRLYTYYVAFYEAPEGWRIPTEEEWDALISLYNGTTFAGKELKVGGSSNLDITLGGYFDTPYVSLEPTFYGLNQASYYWIFHPEEKFGVTAQPFKVFGTDDFVGSGLTFQGYYGFSVRYVREIEE